MGGITVRDVEVSFSFFYLFCYLLLPVVIAMGQNFIMNAVGHRGSLGK